MAWVVAEEVAGLLLTVALGVEEVASQGKQLVEEVAEEERSLQEVAAQVLTRWAAKEVVQAGQRFHEEVEVVAFLQQQHSQLGRKNPVEVVEVGHPNEQAAVVGPKEGVCPRKEAVRGTCLLKVAANQYRPPMESSEVEEEEEDLV